MPEKCISNPWNETDSSQDKTYEFWSYDTQLNITQVATAIWPASRGFSMTGATLLLDAAGADGEIRS